MTDVPGTFSQAECNGATPPGRGEPPTRETSEEVSDVDGAPPHHRVEPSLEGLPTEGNQEKSEKLQGKMLLNWTVDEKILKEKPEEDLFIVHKAITDLSFQETAVDDMTFREGHQWKKTPSSSSTREIRGQRESIAEQPLAEREDEGRKSKAHQATDIEWLGYRKPSQAAVLHEEEQEVWDEEVNNEDDEDQVRVVEFKKENEESSHFREEDGPPEDSPPSAPSSQPVTPDEPDLGKKSDFSRNTYSRYNTISYRKIRRGNTKQRVDEFESMMHL